MPPILFLLKILNEIKKFIKIIKKLLLKPIHGFGGNDIHLLTKFNQN